MVFRWSLFFPLPWPNSHLPEAPLPNTVTLEIRFQHITVGVGVGDTNIQSVAEMVHKLGTSELFGIFLMEVMEPHSRSA